MGYVLVPIIIDSDKIEDRVEQSEAYADLLTVLRALASNDERIIEYFRSITEGKKSTKGKKDFIFSIPASLEIDSEAFARQVELKIWDKLAKLSWRPFEEARKFAQSLGLKNVTQWNDYKKGKLKNLPSRPVDVPTDPYCAYSKLGWKSWGDWIGNGRISDNLREYRPFEEARAFVHTLELKNKEQWADYCKGAIHREEPKPDDIPTGASKTYKNRGWQGWGDWLGTGFIHHAMRDWLPFNEARDFVRSLNLKSGADWKKYCKGEIDNKPIKPNGIPVNAHQLYKDKGWINWYDWVGVSRDWLPFNEARDFVRSLNLKSSLDWKKYCKGEIDNKPIKPNGIPANPGRIYKNKGWKNWRDWIGAIEWRKSSGNYKSFEKARSFARSLELKKKDEWEKFCRGEIYAKGERPLDIPAAPWLSYKNKGWEGWGDWLGTGFIHHAMRDWLPFNEAREFARSLNLKSGADWKKYCDGGIPNLPSLPQGIPKAPNQFYKNSGWVSTGDWLGTNNIATRSKVYLNFEEAREFAIKLKLKSNLEWKTFCKGDLADKPNKPENIPACPNQTYKNKGWTNWGDWLGK